MQKPALVEITEIRTGKSYGSDADITVRLSHPLFKGYLERTVKRGELAKLYALLEGKKKRSGRTSGSLNSGMNDILGAFLDGAHVSLGDQLKETMTSFGAHAPKDEDEVKTSLGSSYLKNKDLRIGTKK